MSFYSIKVSCLLIDADHKLQLLGGRAANSQECGAVADKKCSVSEG